MEQFETKNKIDLNHFGDFDINHEGGASETKMLQEKSYYDDF